jgi:ADP-ribosylglycohydrolase
VAANVFKRVDSGLSFDQAALQVHNESGGFTAGCNPAHRSAPLAMLASVPEDELYAAAIAEASLTHKHPLAGDVSTATVTLCRALVRGNDWTTALRRTQRGRLSQTRAALEAKPTDSLSTGGFAPHVLAAAIHFISDNETFPSAMREAVRFAGPANYCPVLVGSIGGARWGASVIPGDLLGSNFELMPHIREAAENLSANWV